MSPWQPLLDFWFGPLTDGLAHPDKRAHWFSPDPGFDAECSAEFGPLLAPAAAGALDHWQQEPLGRLAFIVLTDQIPRNVYRGSAQAYQWDSYAIAAALDGLENHDDLSLAWDHRSFLYMPFEHSEAIVDQHLAVGLFTFLRDSSPKSMREITGNSLRFAQKHRDIIVKFGRFPHRNAVLGRKSNPDEIAFLKAGDGFGQTL